MIHAYPHDLAHFIQQHWAEAQCVGDFCRLSDGGDSDPLPELPVLEQLLSTCYQASLMHEEERPVRFRLILRDPERFNPHQGPPTGLHRLVFTKSRPFDEHELRRLSPAADFYHSLIGVNLQEDGHPRIWGLVHSGPYWIQAIQGRRRSFFPLPGSLVVSVTDPGLITAAKGSVTIGKIFRGGMITPSTGVFGSQWLQESFAENRMELFDLHGAARSAARKPWARLSPNFPGLIIQRMARQVISTIRNSHHGGTLIFLPPEECHNAEDRRQCLEIKYPFVEEEPRQRIRTLILHYMNALAAACGSRTNSKEHVGWLDYMECDQSAFSQLDEAIVELTNLVARLSAVDGAVVLTNRLELLGFGGEISGQLVSIPLVARALDAEAAQTQPISTEGVGTRHRSAYRLCNTVHDAIAVVVSQDGGVQFVKWKDGEVVFWDQVATSDLDV
ncbi:MAG: hypothetical protein R3231_02385 [bacterium]|nr:hypothetical protein [bacterium]